MSRLLAGLAVITGLTACSALGQAPLGTAFTYQGQLKDAGTPVNGAADFAFKLYDVATGGTPLYSHGVEGAAVVEGLFTVQLDFGSGVFDGTALWLEIDARFPAGGGSWTTLSPRQPMTAAPYALYALSGPGGAGGYWALDGADIYATNAGNVGIGTSDPQDKLHVAGSAAVLRLQDDDDPASYTAIRDNGPAQLLIHKYAATTSPMLLDIAPIPLDEISSATIRFFRLTNTTGYKEVRFLRGNGTTNTSAVIGVDGGDSFFQLHGGNLGIGTDVPTAPLDVAGTVKATAIQLTTGAHNGYVLTSDAAGLATWQPAGAGSCLWDLNGTSVYYNGGYVGVGTTGPSSHLEVSKPYGSASPYVLELTKYTSTMPIRYERLAFDGTAIDSSSSFIAGSMHINGTSSNDVLLVNGGGNVGVGTTDPQVRLHVDGGSDVAPASGGYLVLGSVTGMNVALDNNEIMARDNGTAASLSLNANGGTVWAGASSWTQSSLVVNGGGSGKSNASLQSINTQASGGMAAWLVNGSNAATAHVENAGTGEVLWLERDNASGPFIVAYNDGSDTRPFQVDGNGRTTIIANSNLSTVHLENEGTGEVLWLQKATANAPFIVGYNEQTATRTFQVDADGRTTVSVLQITGGADLSEQFRVAAAQQKPAPGTVVSIDPDHPGDLVVSGRAYDRTVAGVISGAGGVKPGMLMGQANSIADGEHPVALTGRVWCRCNAANGAIQPGDLLTTSDVAGCAMKVTEYDRAHGATIGKAMTALTEGEGLVLVLVGLQ